MQSWQDDTVHLKSETGGQLSAFLTKRGLEALKEKLPLTDGFEAVKPTNKYETLRGRLDGSLIIVYSTGKVVYERSETTRRVIESSAYEATKDDGAVLGSDEAGKGEAVGPMVVGAACLNPRQAARLVSWGVADSKIVPADRMHELAELVMEESLGFKVVSISPAEFNSMIEDAKKQGRNLNDILADAHSDAIRSVLQQVNAPAIRVVVDEFDSSKTGKRLKVIEGASGDRHVEWTPHAEIFPAVAAASILARDGYVKWIEENLEEWQISKLKKGDMDIVKRASDVPKIYKTSYLETILRSGSKRKGHDR
jgi:ribonuclease HIII